MNDATSSHSLPVRFLALGSIVLLAVAFRLLPTPPNFSPIAAMALFAGFSFRNRLAAIALPLVALFLSDVLIGFHDLMWVVYLSFAVITALGIFLRDQKGVAIKGLASVVGSVIFFVATNFAVWAQTGLYPKTMDGLISCYIAALPYFDNSLMGDLTFTTVMFGGWALAERKWPAVRANAVA